MKKVHQYHPRSGKYIRTFNSITDAAKGFNAIPSSIGICAGGRTQTSSGYRWSFEKYDVIPITRERYASRRKPVLRIDPKNGEETYYKSLEKAAEENYAYRQNISNAIKRKGLHLGYVWRFVKEI